MPPPHLLLLLALSTCFAASPDAAGSGGSGADTQQQQQQKPTPDAAACSAEPGATNVARAVSGKQLHSLLLEDRRNSTLVVLFHLPGDPHSDAMLPVFDCLPAFFNASEVHFVSASYTELNFMALISQGLHALPVLQVDAANGQKYRFSGKHRLVPMLQFVSAAASLQPLVSLEDVRACTAGSAEQEACSRVAACARTDGEVTLAELRAQRRGPLFTFSAGFLALRGLWWLGARWRKRHATATGAGM